MNDVNVSILSFVALAMLFDQVKEEIRERLAGLSDPDQNMRDLLILDGETHGLDTEAASAEVDGWLEDGYTYGDIIRIYAIDDAVSGVPSSVLPAPDPQEVSDSVEIATEDEEFRDEEALAG